MELRIDLFSLQNARKGRHESHDISPVPKGKPGLLVQMWWMDFLLLSSMLVTREI